MEEPNIVQDIQCFLGFANFYRFFIQDYSKIAAPLMHFTYKDKLEWSVGRDQVFQDLKTAFITVLIFIHLDFLKPFFFESNASNYALGVVLFQKGEDKQLHPVAFN
jgi:hypothetical protein